MQKDYGRKRIQIGFILVSLVLTLPTLFVFIYMLKVKNGLIEHVDSEIFGSREVRSVVNQLLDKRDPVLTKKGRELADQYRVILDTNLDTHYITVIAVVRLPLIYKFLIDYNQAKSNSELQGLDKDLVANHLVELTRAYNLATEEDKNFYGENELLQSKSFATSYKVFYDQALAFVSDPKAKSDEGLFTLTHQFWIATLDVLDSLHEQRRNNLLTERNHAIVGSIGFWILSLVLVFFFARRVLKSQDTLREEISEQHLQLAFASKLSAIGQISSGIAHEINTPLAVIRLQSELLIENAKTDQLKTEECKAIGENIVTVVDQVSEVITSMRNISRGDGTAELKTENLARILSDVLILCGSNLKQHGIELSNQAEKDLWIKCRSTEMAQVLINLVNNAIDACANSIDKKIVIHSSSESSTIKLQFCDSGPTISNDVRNQLFKRQFSTKTNTHSAGLGLQIVQNIVHDFAGSIRLLDGPTTCFELEFPKVSDGKA